MPERTDRMTAHQLLEWLLASDSRDEIHGVVQVWLRANPLPVPPPLYAVFGYPLTRPGERELLGVYTSLERAEAFVAAQDREVQANLRVENLEIDHHPSDEFWKRPKGERDLRFQRDLHAVADQSIELPNEGLRNRLLAGAATDPAAPADDAYFGRLRSRLDNPHSGSGNRLVDIIRNGELLPDDAIAAIEAMRNDERDVATLRIRAAELERGRAAHTEWLRETVATLPAAEAVEAIRRYLGDSPSRSLADLRDEMRAVVRGEWKMPPPRRAMLETPASRERFLSQLAQLREGDGLDLHVCYRLTRADQDRLRERIRVLADLEGELRRVWEMPRHDEVSDRIERYRPQLERLAADEECARVCGYCGRAISQIAGYVEQSVLSHTHAPGTCDVCGLVGSVSPSEDWIGQGD